MRYIRNNAGATAIEYGLIAALIAVAGILVMTDTGEKISDLLCYSAEAINNQPVDEADTLARPDENGNPLGDSSPDLC